MSLKDILVHLDGSEQSATRLRLAERQFAPAVETLRARLASEPKRQ